MRAQTIEQTAKPWKAIQAAGIVILLCGIVGFVAFEGDAALSAALFAGAGLALRLFGRIGAWWNHG